MRKISGGGKDGVFSQPKRKRGERQKSSPSVFGVTLGEGGGKRGAALSSSTPPIARKEGVAR